MIALVPKSLAVGLLLAAAAPAIACDYPEGVQIPDGLAATEEQMIAADSAVQNLIADMNDYIACVEAKTQSLRNQSPHSGVADAKAREDWAIRENNRAAQAMADVMEQFNQAVADYQSRN